MIIDVAFVDVLMIFSTALSIVLRASRHMSSRHPVVASQPHSGLEDGKAHHVAGGTSSWPHHVSVALRSAPARLRTLRHNAEYFPHIMHVLAATGNVLSLVSNCLTHLLRPSQVLYAMLLVMCDVVMEGRDRPRRRGGYFMSLVVLLVVLYILHEQTAWFAIGDWCGYVNGLMQVFLLGAVIGCPGNALVPVFVAKHGAAVNVNTLVAEFTLERSTACISTLCYLAMLLDEGEAVYSSHSEFVRWYVANVALLLHDAIQLWRFVLRGSGGVSSLDTFVE